MIFLSEHVSSSWRRATHSKGLQGTVVCKVVFADEYVVEPKKVIQKKRLATGQNTEELKQTQELYTPSCATTYLHLRIQIQHILYQL